RLAKDAVAAPVVARTREALLRAHATRLQDAATQLTSSLARVAGPDARPRLDVSRLEALGPSLHAVDQALAAVAAAGEGEGTPGLRVLARRAGMVRQAVDGLAEREAAAQVRWIQPRGHGFTLHTAPIRSADALRERLYTRQDTLVFTSATLAT